MTSTAAQASTSEAVPSTDPTPTPAPIVIGSAEHFSSLGTKYEAYFGHDAGLRRFVQQAVTHLPPKASVLDVGCGTGNPVAKTIAAGGHHVHGIDISEEMVRLSRIAVPSGRFEIADMQTWTPPEVLRLDAIFVMLSLFAFGREEIEEVIGRMGSFLKTGGTLCVGSIAAEDCHPESKGKKYDDDGFCARDIGWRFMGRSDEAITLFTREGWKHLLSENRFEIVDTLTELFVPPAEAECDDEMHYFIISKKL